MLVFSPINPPTFVVPVTVLVEDDWDTRPVLLPMSPPTFVPLPAGVTMIVTGPVENEFTTVPTLLPTRPPTFLLPATGPAAFDPVTTLPLSLNPTNPPT